MKEHYTESPFSFRGPRFHHIVYIPEGGEYGFGRFKTEFADGSIGEYHPTSKGDINEKNALKQRHHAKHAKNINSAPTNLKLPAELRETAADHTEISSSDGKSGYMNLFPEPD